MGLPLDEDVVMRGVSCPGISPSLLGIPRDMQNSGEEVLSTGSIGSG